jgi:hypothetical protein
MMKRISEAAKAVSVKAAEEAGVTQMDNIPGSSGESFGPKP